MKFESYHEWTPTTAQYPTDTEYMMLSYVTLGLAGELGELGDLLLGAMTHAGGVANQVKKISRDDAGSLLAERREKIKGEIGDVFWYLSQVCHRLDVSVDEILQGNFEKLMKRQHDGTLFGDRRGSAYTPPSPPPLQQRPGFEPSGISLGQPSGQAGGGEEGGMRMFVLKLRPERGPVAGRTVRRQFPGCNEDEARLNARRFYGPGTAIYHITLLDTGGEVLF